MFQASSAHLQQDTVVYMQHMVLSEFLVACRYTAYVTVACRYTAYVTVACRYTAYVTVPGGLLVHSISCVPTGHQELS